MSSSVDQTGSAVTEVEPESPFPDRYEPKPSGEDPAARASVWRELESPFLSQLESESPEGEDPRAQMYAELLAELHDEEMDEAINELVHEAAAVYEDRINHEFGDPGLQRASAEQAVREYLAPLVDQTEQLLDTIGEAAQQRDIASMSEDQLQEWFEQFEPSRGDLSPAFEGFLGGLVKKISKVAGGVSKLAKKGLKVAVAIGTGGLSLILPKIRQLVQPLLNRVLRAAIGKLPPALRPAASQLAKKFLGAGETATEGEENEDENLETDSIQREMDLGIAGSLTAESAEESEAAIAEYEAFEEPVSENEFDVLQDARERFVGQISSLKEGEDVRPAMEEFIPAVLPALRIGIRLIGRPRVVKFLAGLIAKLIARFVGPQMAGPLSQAIVDTGLRMISLETTEQSEARTSANAIAATVEETVQQIASLPESVYEDPELLEAYTLEAFEQAAAANFPAEMIKPELRESSVNGTWVLMPLNSPRKFYKKYTVVFDRTLTPQQATRIATFGGVPLMTALRDQFNIDPSKEFRAKVHLYEAIPGTWLSRISAMERGVPGLGSAAKSSWSRIHPLTSSAAATLLGEPGLGRDIAPRFLSNRNLIGVGERFYYLEIEGTRPVVHPNQRPRRTSRVYLRINCPQNRIVVTLFLSERDAQTVSTRLRQNSPWPNILRVFTTVLQTLGQSSLRARNIKIVHEAVAMEEYRKVAKALPVKVPGIYGQKTVGSVIRGAIGKPGLAGALQAIPPSVAGKVNETIAAWALRKLSEFLKGRREEFIKATEDAADGVSIRIIFVNPPLLSVVCKFLRGAKPMSPLAGLFRTIPGAMVKISPGLHRA